VDKELDQELLASAPGFSQQERREQGKSSQYDFETGKVTLASTNATNSGSHCTNLQPLHETTGPSLEEDSCCHVPSITKMAASTQPVAVMVHQRVAHTVLGPTK
jgi:hypothetical protein